MKYKYKIKSWKNDMGVYHLYKKRWFGLYTSAGYGSGNAEDMIKLDVENINKPKTETVYYNVEVNGDAIKMEKEWDKMTNSKWFSESMNRVKNSTLKDVTQDWIDGNFPLKEK